MFGSLRRPLVAAFAGGGPEAELLSARMQDAWLAFARSGDPSHEDIGVWPAWDHDRQATMVFGPKCGVEERPRHPELQAWGGVAGPRAEREATGAG